jgi:peptide-methionine (S)-S-oxide reductase
MHDVGISKIGFGGGCHWCTEAIFESLIGIKQVNQGWIASTGVHSEFSEAIEVYFDDSVITLSTLIEIHLYTHASTSNHSMRKKYRSAIYTYDDIQYKESFSILEVLQENFTEKIVTRLYPFVSFKTNKPEWVNYLYNSPNKPFCKTYIHPKLNILLKRFKHQVNYQKLNELSIKFTGQTTRTID